MSSLLERLRNALAPDYEIVREIGRGGMGIVYLGRDTTLDRSVAIKLLRPELVTAVALERFLREARLLAATRHPNIVTIHQAREAGGLAYLVMDYLEGESLEERLARGPLPPDEVVALADDLLAGLAEAHARGIVHRDVKPANVMFVDGHYVLGDFGIAKRPESDSATLTHPEGRPGTPAYMSPEQVAGGVVTARTDVYGAGALLYEALTGRRWQFGDLPEDGVWTGVPRRLVALVGRALALAPEQRYQHAGVFRRAFKPRGTRVGKVLPLAALAAGIALAIWAIVAGRNGSASLAAADLALLPLEPTAGSQDWLALEIPLAVYLHLEGGFQDEGLRLVSVGQSRRWWDSAAVTGQSAGRAAWEGLRATHAASGSYRQWGDSLEVQVRVIDSAGTRRPTPEAFRGTVPGLNDLGFVIAHAVAQAVDPTRAARFRGSPGLRGVETAPYRELLRAEAAFAREDWAAAASGYRRAVTLDSTLALAWWGLFNALRWARETPEFDLGTIYARYRDDFSPVQQLLIEAETGAPGRARFAHYAEAIAREPRDGYVQLLYGNELFHRGALFGVGLDSARHALERATAKHPWLAPAFSTLAWADIRRGDRAGARAALDRYHTIAAVETAEGFSFAQFLEYAFVERFHPEQAGRFREGLLDRFRSPEARRYLITHHLRWAPASGVPHAQLALADQLRRAPALSVGERANLFEARGLALYHFGRVREALAAFDSAAALFGTPAARLEAAQWRLLPHAMGLRPAEARDLEAARGMVQSLAADSLLGNRVAWTMAADALGRGALDEADGWIVRLATRTPLVHLARAQRALVAGDTGAVVELTGPYLPVSTARHDGGGDPFARSVAHLLRGTALVARREPAATSEFLWYENADIGGWPSGPAQAGEVDWALATYGALRWAHAEEALGDARAACIRYAAIAATWERADRAVREAVRLDARQARACR